MDDFNNQLSTDDTQGNQEDTSIEREETFEGDLPSSATQTYKTQGNEPDELPESASDRTRGQFEKLRNSNKELSEKLKQYEQLIPFGNANQVNTAGIADYVDPEGNVDIERLNQHLMEAKEAKRIALETQAMIQVKQEQEEEKEAYGQFPWLNPKSPDFNKKAYDLVVDKVVRKRYLDGEPVRLVELAAEVDSLLPKNTEKEKLEAVEAYKQTEVQKRSTAPVYPGKGQPRASTAQLDELRKRTLSGDSTAIQERLKQSGY